MEAGSEDVDAVIRALVASPGTVEAISAAPAAPGLYAWWAPPTILPSFSGRSHPERSDLRLLYVGIATKLRSRLGQNHMRRSGSSTLRRTLAGLLLDEESYRTRWTSRVVLVDEDEIRLTRWMTANLSVSWTEHARPRSVERAIIEKLGPPLNVDHSAEGPAREAVTAARRRYHGSAGPRPGA